MNRRRLVAWGPSARSALAVGLILLLGAVAHAASLKLSLDQLASGADTIVVGTVSHTEAFWDLDQSSIYTAVTLAVDDQLKGPPLGRTVSLLVLGGTVGEMGMAVSDMPRFALGEQAVLFLKALSPERLAERRLGPAALPYAPFEVYGNDQGKLEVVGGLARGIPLGDLLLHLRRLEEDPGGPVPMTLAPENPVEPLYAPTGQRWPGEWPNVSYVVHTGFTDAQNWAIRSSANTWTTAGARFTYTYAGTHSRAGGAQRNGVNEVVWADLGDGPTLGRGTWWYSGSTIIEIDVEFNTRHSWSTSTPPTANDFESVSLHELGHCLGLGHTDVADAVMYYQLMVRTAKRALHADDLAGVRAIYGVPGTPPAEPALSVTPATRNVDAGAGTTTFGVTNTGGGTMNWTAAVTAGGGWLHITSGASGTNAGTITISYTANPGPSSRTGTITVTAPGATGSPATVTVVQAGGAPAENRPPTVSLRYSPANPTTADTIVFTATATDPDGDPLRYEWYLNGTRQTEVSPTASEVRWPNPRAGTHTLRVGVSDGRGGTAEASVTFTVTAGEPPPEDGNSHTYGSVAGWYLVSVPVAAGAPEGVTMWWWNPSSRSYVRPSTIYPQVGYWARLGASTRFSVTGSPPASDVSLELGVAGWHMVSAPWTYPKGAIQVVRGGEARGWADAVAAGWVRNAIYGFKATDGAYTSSTTLSPWYGYWLEARVPGLTLRFAYASRATAAALLADRGDSSPLWNSPSELPPPPPEGGGAVAGELRFANHPNPITDVQTTTFQVTGPMASLVTEIRVVVFDLSGKLVWQGRAAGAELSWHTEDLAGRYLANGVYLYQITAEVAGTTVTSPLLKLAIYR